MNEVDDLARVARNWPEKLRDFKRSGTKLVGYVGRFVPEELIYASGAVPYLMCRGGEPEPPEAVLPYMLRFMSPYTRSQIGSHLLGMDPVIPLFDLIVLQNLDCHEVRIADLFEYFKLPAMRLGVPSDWQRPASAEYYYEGLCTLKGKLESLTGNSITDEKLRQSIAKLNEVRGILRKINLLRRLRPPVLGGFDFLRLDHCSFYNDLDDTIASLKSLYERLQVGTSPFEGRAPRLLVTGHVVAVGDYIMPKLVEDSGAVIVGEFLDEGTRQWAWDVGTDGDPMRNLAQTYFLGRMPPSQFQPAWARRIQHIRDLIKDLEIDGVLLYTLFMEETYDLEASLVLKAMEEMRVPCLRLDSSYEYSREAMGPLTTRIESFVESLRMRRPR